MMMITHTVTRSPSESIMMPVIFIVIIFLLSDHCSDYLCNVTTHQQLYIILTVLVPAIDSIIRNTQIVVLMWVFKRLWPCTIDMCRPTTVTKQQYIVPPKNTNTAPVKCTALRDVSSCYHGNNISDTPSMRRFIKGVKYTYNAWKF